MALLVALGADPDTTRPSIAAVCIKTGAFIGACIVRAPGTGPEAIAYTASRLPEACEGLMSYRGGVEAVCAAIEGQNVTYSSKKGVSPQSLVPTAVSSGVLMAVCAQYCPDATWWVLPHAWKGDIKKLPHHRQMYRRMKVPFEERGDYCIPDFGEYHGKESINLGDWKHIGDSLGLALWAREKYLKAKKPRGEAKKRYLELLKREGNKP